MAEVELPWMALLRFQTGDVWRPRRPRQSVVLPQVNNILKDYNSASSPNNDRNRYSTNGNRSLPKYMSVPLMNMVGEP